MLLETMGLSKFISIIIGVPAMISFIYVIWHSLSVNQQIATVICLGIVILAIGLFIYGETRRILCLIPNILYRMHCRASELSSDLDISKLEMEDVGLFLSLLDVDIAKVLPNKNNATEEEAVKEALESVQLQVQSSAKLDKDTPIRASRYLGEQIGLRQLLKTDKKYQKLMSKLRSIRPLIHTEEISMAVNEYIKTSEGVNSFLPLVLKMKNEEISKILPLKIKVNGLGIDSMIEDGMANLLSRVWENIDSYYRKR